MQAVQLPDDLLAGAQVKVIRIGEDHLAADLAQLAGIQRLDGGEGTDRHERGRFDSSVRSDEGAGARCAGIRGDGEVERRFGHGVVFSSSVATAAFGAQEYPAVIGAWSPSAVADAKRSCAASPPNRVFIRSSGLGRARIASRTDPSTASMSLNPASPNAIFPEPISLGHSAARNVLARDRNSSGVMRPAFGSGRNDC